MNLRKAIDAEHSSSQTARIARYAASNAARFKELVEVFLEGPYRTTQRASWPLSKCAETVPGLVRPHIGRLVRRAALPDVHPAVRRNVMRLLQFVDVPRRYHGEVVDLAFKFLNDRKEPVAIRVFAMTTIFNLAEKHDYPELTHELRLLIAGEIDIATPGFISRGRKILNALETKMRPVSQ